MKDACKKKETGFFFRFFRKRDNSRFCPMHFSDVLHHNPIICPEIRKTPDSVF